MADGFVQPLSGEEVISDVLAQIEKSLKTDCNLRGSDAYSGGYEGTIKVSLTLKSMDTVRVEMEIPIVPDAEVVKQEDPEVQTEPVKVETEVEIPLETNLDEVRERSGQGVPIQTMDPTTGQAVVKKRKYTRRAEGGAL